MREIFYPNSVVVVGVSAKPDNLGYNIVANLMDFGFKGIVYAVGPRGGVIATRRIYHSVHDIPDHVDLAIILAPARVIPEILEGCGQKGIRWAVIETAGFGEYGEKGQQIEDEVVRVAKEYNIRFIGPNCIGAINMETIFNVFPFENTITVMYLSGREMQELFDYITERSHTRGCQSQAQSCSICVTGLPLCMTERSGPWSNPLLNRSWQPPPSVRSALTTMTVISTPLIANRLMVMI